jgi:tRNA threonylcarbamoyladenosine biosynthesis protein TsaB
MPAIAHVLEAAGVGWDEVEAIGVGVGPGTFTGLRIGVATARALAQARSIELRPVSSLAALAEGIPGELRLALIDARRGELFAALHDAGGERWEPWVATPAEVAERVRAAGFIPRAAGDGSVRFRDVLEPAGIEIAPDGDPVHVVRGLHVCRLAARTPAAAPEAVVPRYLRLPDAKPKQ